MYIYLYIDDDKEKIQSGKVSYYDIEKGREIK